MAKDNIEAIAEATAQPAGREPIIVALKLTLNGVPRDPRAVKAGILRGATEGVKELLSQAVRAIEAQTGVPLEAEPASLPWMKMQRAHYAPDRIEEMVKLHGLTVEEVTRDDVFRNDQYQAIVRVMPDAVGRPSMAHLSIRRNDRAAVRDWRHFQNIKNDIFGPEAEACEIYPSESRLVDESNQYHLWVITTPGCGFPFGFSDRAVGEDTSAFPGAVQRKFHPQDKPSDADASTHKGYFANERAPADIPTIPTKEECLADPDSFQAQAVDSVITPGLSLGTPEERLDRCQKALIACIDMMPASLRRVMLAFSDNSHALAVSEAAFAQVSDVEIATGIEQIIRGIPTVKGRAADAIEPIPQVKAPFTAEQVKSLNEFQRSDSGFFHKFTCDSPTRDDENHQRASRVWGAGGPGFLVAEQRGWHCPGCGYTQDWAHLFMADGTWKQTAEEQEKLLRDLRVSE